MLLSKNWLDGTTEYRAVLTPEEKEAGFKFDGKNLTDLQIKWIRDDGLPWEEKKPEEPEEKKAEEEEKKREEKKPEEEEKKPEEEKKKG